MAADIVNNENYPIESSPLITLRGKALNGDVSGSPRTPKSNEKRYISNNFRNSPRRSTPNSPKISRLPIRSGTNTRFSIKELRLPPDESVTNCGGVGSVRVTPEKLMEELRDEVKKKKKLEGPPRVVDEEISLSVANCQVLEQVTSETCNLSIRPRMSMRNRQPVMVDAPDLVYDDPLEVARQTLANTRANSGYKQCKLIYTTERRRMGRSSSPEPAFSKKTGITRHFLNITTGDVTDGENEEEEVVLPVNGDSNTNSSSFVGVGLRKALKFDRVLKLFESTEAEAEIENELGFEIDLEMKPKKPCLKPSKSNATDCLPDPLQIVQIKRICYEDEIGEVVSGSPTKKRRIGNGAKRLKKNE